MDITTSLVLIVVLIACIYYWIKNKERDVFWLMILAIASLLLKGWRIVEDNYFKFPGSILNIFLILRILFSIAIIVMVIKILFFTNKRNIQ
jgi:hypothetical protein